MFVVPFQDMDRDSRTRNARMSSTLLCATSGSVSRARTQRGRVGVSLFFFSFHFVRDLSLPSFPSAGSILALIRSRLATGPIDCCFPLIRKESAGFCDGFLSFLQTLHHH